MNRTFTAISLQAALATAVLTVAPLAGAATSFNDEAHGPQIGSFVSQVSRDQVRAEAVAAARQVYTRTDQQNEPQAAAAGSTLTRAQVRAEAVEANQMALTSSGEHGVVLRASQQGERVASATPAVVR